MQAPASHRYLRAWREHSELTLEEAARRAGLGGKMALSRLETGKRRLRADQMAALSRVYGADLDELRGPPPTASVGHHLAEEAAPDYGSSGAAVEAARRGMTLAADVMEIDVRAGGGSLGALDDDRVITRWQMPPSAFAGITGAPVAALRIITAIGDSMEPEIPPGAKLLVDTVDRRPTPPGIFILWDGLGIVVKRVEFVPLSDPPRVRLSSDNARYQAYERLLDEAQIQGRVIGQWRWR